MPIVWRRFRRERTALHVKLRRYGPSQVCPNMRRRQKASMKLLRSSSFQSCRKPDRSSSVMIQYTSSTSHLRYVSLNSVLSGFLTCLRFSGMGRFSGSVWVPSAASPLTSESFVSLAPRASAAPAKPNAITLASTPAEQRFLNPAENIERDLPHGLDVVIRRLHSVRICRSEVNE